METERKQDYATPTADVCRVDLEGVVAESTSRVGFAAGENGINDWQEVELGEAHVAGEGGDVYVSSW